MAYYDWLFNSLGLRQWCDEGKGEALVSLRSLMKKEAPWYEIPFPSLDNLHAACDRLWQTRDLTVGLREGFLGIKPYLRLVLDPLTQPLSWMLEGALWLFTSMPWYVLVPLLLALTQYVTRKAGITLFVAICFAFLSIIDHYTVTIETLSIIFICTILCVLFGVPIGIAMSKNDRLEKGLIPVLDILQTLPSFVYLIPLIFLFSVTEPKIYGIAIILYAIVPVVRLTNLGIRLVDKDVKEAGNAFGMNRWQMLFGLEIPLALPNIMAGVNQTIMMALAMVVIASLVSAPGLGTLVLDGINNLRLGVGFVAGFGIVMIAVILDRVTKAALARINSAQQ